MESLKGLNLNVSHAPYALFSCALAAHLGIPVGIKGRNPYASLCKILDITVVEDTKGFSFFTDVSNNYSPSDWMKIFEACDALRNHKFETVDWAIGKTIVCHNFKKGGELSDGIVAYGYDLCTKPEGVPDDEIVFLENLYEDTGELIFVTSNKEKIHLEEEWLFDELLSIIASSKRVFSSFGAVGTLATLFNKVS